MPLIKPWFNLQKVQHIALSIQDSDQSLKISHPMVCSASFHSKMNVDVSHNLVLSRSAIGGVFRNAIGEFLCMFSCPIPPKEINLAEVLAIHSAIHISLECDKFCNQPIVIESESCNVVNWCSSSSGGPWNLNFIMNFIRFAPRRGLSISISISHQKIILNIVADAFAKHGFFRTFDFVAWI